jgi:hypothetical protein
VQSAQNVKNLVSTGGLLALRTTSARAVPLYIIGSAAVTSIRICEPQRQTSVADAAFQMGDEAMPTTRTGGSKRGFAAMDPAKQREIASKGGKASHGGGRKSTRSR